ncbi:MAG: hypothetical protein ACI8P5_002088, partial [Bacteroidia bacterium]
MWHAFIAKGSYIEVIFRTNTGELTSSTESGCLKTFEKVFELS